ncbi:MAG: S24 family peptidase [Candidatus Gracilibacteria bacterium]|nr:S24 family peptidase [Candidatus Gracilibacteria bacterium]
MLTEKQQYVLDTITNFISRYGKSPTIDELAELLEQKSKRGVVQYLEALEKKGFLTRGRGYRSISLGNGVGFQTTLNIPILGYANAGIPLVEATESDYGTLPISKKIISGDEKNYFVLKVEGTSMNNYDLGGKVIDNGSYVLIKKDEVNTNSRDAFLFIVNGAATLKRFKKDGSTVYLLPESKDEFHKPIILSEDDNIMVNGKVVDVFNF